MQMECEYYLGHGNRAIEHLSAGDETSQIEKMKEIYEGLPVKPAWIAMEKICEYEKAMVGGIMVDVGRGYEVEIRPTWIRTVASGFMVSGQGADGREFSIIGINDEFAKPLLAYQQGGTTGGRIDQRHKLTMKFVGAQLESGISSSYRVGPKTAITILDDGIEVSVKSSQDNVVESSSGLGALARRISGIFNHSGEKRKIRSKP
jgi:hypothetical protein